MLAVTSRGFHGPRSFFLQLGPNDHRYLTGFLPHYEVANEIATRWTTYDARINLPFTIEGGPVTIAYRFSRVFGETAEVELYLADVLADRFSRRGGEVVTREARLAAVSRTPLTLSFDIDSHERQNLGLRMDWIRIDVGEKATLRLRGTPRWLPVIFAAFLLALFRFAGFSRTSSVLLSLLWVGAVVVWPHVGLFGFAHIVAHVSLPAMLLSAIACVFLRRWPGGRWVVPIFVAGYLLKAGGLFHPQTFYPDVANARDYVEVFRETSGAIAERGVETQTRTYVGYPRTIAGKDYAFPYSPLYFLPFSVVSDPDHIEDAVRHAGLAAAALTTVPLFWIAATVFGPRTGIAASTLWAFLPPIFSRLLLALHATVVGNFLDTLVIASVLALSFRPSSRKCTAATAGATLASLLVYTSSLVSVSVFFVAASILDRKLAAKLLVILASAALVTVGWLYWPFTIAFFSEILPAVVRGAGMEGGTPADSAWVAFGRIPLFYGYAYPVLAVAGLVIARRRADERSYRVLLAWSLAFAFMLGLRAFGAGLFKDLKEITFVAPLVAILTGASLATLERKGRLGRWAAIFLMVGLSLFGLSRYRGYLESYRSPMVSADPPQTN